jgi:hypothetical protein
MAAALLDTTAASLFLPQRGQRPERAFHEPHLRGCALLALSFQSVAERWKLAERNGWGERRRSALDDFLRRPW